MSVMGKVLIVDDDPEVRAMLSEYLSAHGYTVWEAESGIVMRQVLGRDVPDVVLLDLSLAGEEDGLALARYLRERYRVGIIMVTASGDVVDRIVGLEVGADDYIAKPFDPRELRARLKSLLRRCQAEAPGLPGSAPGQSGRQVRIGPCVLDLDAHRLQGAGGREIPLTAMEFELLRALTEHPNQVLSRDQLLTLTRNRDWEPFDRSIDIRIARLRKKIEADPDRPQMIRTVRGAGYMYVPPRLAAGA